MKFNGNTVVITGGASGIGRIMGKLALERGASHLVIWDINEQNLQSTVAEYSAFGKVTGIKVDVSSTESIDEAYAKTKEACGQVDIMIQCAGIIANNKMFHEQTDKDIIRTMNINSTAPMLVALRVLPDMIARDKGHVCTVASAAGMLAMPKMSVYTSSKWAAYGWSDSVKLELKELKSHVRVTTVAPYFIDTGMFQGIRSRIFPLLDPMNTSRKIMNAIEKNKDRRGIPFSFHFIRFCQALFPSFLFDIVFGKIAGLYCVMDHYTGRK